MKRIFLAAGLALGLGACASRPDLAGPAVAYDSEALGLMAAGAAAMATPLQARVLERNAYLQSPARIALLSQPSPFGR